MLKAPLSRVAPLALALVVWVVVPTSAGADVPVTDVSWWTRSPAPPSVPAGGFSVGSAPDGSLSVAAIHVNVSHGASKANIQLTEASTGEGSQAGAIDVCRATAEWVPTNGGNINQAPPADCASAVHLTRDAASGVWTGDLMPLLGSASGTVGLVIQPGPAPASAPGASASAYQASFAPPHIDGAVLTGSESSSSDSTSSSSSSSSSSFASDSSSSSSFSSASPSLSASSGSFSPGDLSASLTTSAAVAPPPSAAAEAQAEAPPTNTPFVPYRPANGGPIKRGVSAITVIGWIVLSLVIGAAAAATRWARGQGRIPGLGGGGRRILQPPAV